MSHPSILSGFLNNVLVPKYFRENNFFYTIFFSDEENHKEDDIQITRRTFDVQFKFSR